MTPLVISIAAFVCVSALVGALALVFRGNSDNVVEDRLAMLTGSGSGKQAKDGLLLKQSVLSQPLVSSQSFLEGLVSRFNLALLFEQADTTLTVQHFLIISIGLGFAGAAVATVAQINPGLVLLVAIAVGFLPLLWVTFRKKRRLKAFGRQLPDALELVARALRAGHSLAAGLNLVAGEMTNPIAKEFGRVFEETNLGIAMEEALENMSTRIPNLDLRFFATAVILQRQTGGDLAEILDKIGELVRERFKIWGQVQALTGEGRLSGIVLLALPPVLFGAVYRLNPDYVMVLFTDPMGKKMLIGGIVMQLLGAIAIRKIIDIKV
jgi:tight adherence protein B